MPTTIYALCEPDLQVPVIRYIGKTVNLAKRVRDHRYTSPKKNTHLGCWLRSLTARGEKPVLLSLCEVPDDIGAAAEILYIRLARAGGMDLVNATDGGEGITMTPETCSKISAAKKGQKSPNLGVKMAEAQKVKIGETRRAKDVAKGGKNPFFGRSHSEESLSKQRTLKLGEKNPMYGRPSPNRGKNPSDSTRALLSLGGLRRLPMFSAGGGI